MLNTARAAIWFSGGDFKPARESGRKSVSGGNSSGEAVASGNSSKEAVSTENANGEAVSAGNSSEEAVSPGISSGEAVSARISSGEAVSAGNSSEEAVSAGISSGEAVSAGISSREAVSAGNVSGEAISSRAYGRRWAVSTGWSGGAARVPGGDAGPPEKGHGRCLHQYLPWTTQVSENTTSPVVKVKDFLPTTGAQFQRW